MQKKTPKRPRCDSFEEFLSKQLKEAEAQIQLKPARPRAPSLVPLETKKTKDAPTNAPEKEFGQSFWPVSASERPRFDSFDLDVISSLDSFELASTEDLEALDTNTTIDADISGLKDELATLASDEYFADLL